MYTTLPIGTSLAYLRINGIKNAQTPLLLRARLTATDTELK